MVLVVGASGLLGHRIAHLLLDDGRSVRAASRNPERLVPLAERGAETVAADLRDPASLDRALEGARYVVTTANAFIGRGDAAPAHVDRTGNQNLIDAARRAGVEHFVFTSAHLPDAYHAIDFFRYKSETEQYLRDSGVPFTVLRPSAFMDTWVQMIGDPLVAKGKAQIFGSGRQRMNFVAVEDVARVAVWTVGRPEAIGQTLVVAGPDNLTPLEAADAIERATGRRGGRSHVPAFLMRVLPPLVGLFNPVAARQMRAGALMDRYDQAVEVPTLPEGCPVPATRVEDWARAHYA